MSGDGTPRYIVVDASVSLKWALDDEEAVASAVTLRNVALDGQFQMVAPTLWMYELTNGLVTAVRRGRLSADVGLEALDLLLTVGVRLADPQAADVYTTSSSYGIAAYDAAYLALADTLAAPLWTGDRRLYDAVRDRAPFVHWIGDYR